MSVGASVELSTFLPSKGRLGSCVGALPVAMRMNFAAAIAAPAALELHLHRVRRRDRPALTCSILCFLNR